MMGEVYFDNMCDGCFKFLEDGEKKFSLFIVDDSGNEKGFRGHEECMKKIRDKIEEQIDK